MSLLQKSPNTQSQMLKTKKSYNHSRTALNAEFLGIFGYSQSFSKLKKAYIITLSAKFFQYSVQIWSSRHMRDFRSAYGMLV
jgi:hypothetical protein